ncbi:hypothetical protein ACJJTC_012033 [Scirpophaga incertulas]
MQQEDKNTIYQMRFPQKLWYLLNMHTKAILWGGTGRTILLNYRILHCYLQSKHSIFKTANISSFVRQLNLYGFRKVTSHLQDPLCNSSNPFMHEYVHDYFQHGKPDLLNKITRKALTIKKTIKPKATCDEQLFYLTPLQKARKSLREALKRAAQDLYMQNSPKRFCNLQFNFECDPYDDEENIEIEWSLPNNFENNAELLHHTAPKSNNEEKDREGNPVSFGNAIQEDDLLLFEVRNDQNHDSVPTQFLSMPDLDSEPNEDDSNIELLAEFNIQVDDNVSKETNIEYSLNCVLPSVINNSIDDVAVSEREGGNLDAYNIEWVDQMFNDILTNKNYTNQDSSSELKELYSQIARTIDVLND